jgi:hypothetical protein
MANAGLFDEVESQGKSSSFRPMSSTNWLQKFAKISESLAITKNLKIVLPALLKLAN